MIDPTEEQSAIVSAVETGQSTIVQAYAGTGKTTTAVMAARAISRRFKGSKKLFLAFNTTVKEEVADRLRTSPDWEVRTLNSLGQGTLMVHSALWGWGNNGSPHVDKKKVSKIVDSMLKKSSVKAWLAKVRLNADVGGTIEDLIDKAKVFGVRPEAVTPEMLVKLAEVESGLETGSASKEAVAQSQSTDALTGLAKLVKSGLNTSIDQARKQGIIDFNDQVYLAVLYCPSHGRSWDIVITDESQDLSSLNHQQVVRCCRQQLIILGDKNQALYQFRGATSESMDDLSRLWVAKNNTAMAELKLTITFRCPIAVVARQIITVGIDDFKARGAAPPGSVFMPYVSRRPSFTWSCAGILNRLLEASLKHRAVILSATNAPLYMMAAVLWSDLNCSSIEDFRSDVRCVCEPPLKSKLNTATSQPVLSLPQYRSRADIAGLHILHKVSGLNSDGIAKLFAHDPNQIDQPITLSTVHRSKGLEWDHVYILEPKAMGDKGNIRYVAETRTKQHLGTIAFENHFQALRPGSLVAKYCGRSKPFQPCLDEVRRLETSVADIIEGNMEWTPWSVTDAWPTKEQFAETLNRFVEKMTVNSPYNFDPTAALWESTHVDKQKLIANS